MRRYLSGPLAGLLWNRWTDSNGIGGRNHVESAAGIVWNSQKIARCKVTLHRAIMMDDFRAPTPCKWIMITLYNIKVGLKPFLSLECIFC